MFRLFEKEGEAGGGKSDDTPLKEDDFLEIEQDEEEPLKEGDEGYVAPTALVADPPSKKFDFTRFKTYNPELAEDEEQAYSWIEDQIKENQNLRLVAKGREVIEQDPDINIWQGHLKSDEETLFKTAEVIAGRNAGESLEDAQKAADEKYERFKTNNPDAITDKVRQVKAMLRGNIANKEKDILAAQETARQSIKPVQPAKEINDTAVSEVAKLDSILGIKLSFKDKSKLDVLTGKAERAISSGELMKKLTTDPKLLAKVAFMVENEAEYIKNIKKLGKGQATILNKMQDKGDKQITPKPGGSGAGAGKGDKSETQKIQEANW